MMGSWDMGDLLISNPDSIKHLPFWNPNLVIPLINPHTKHAIVPHTNSTNPNKTTPATISPSPYHKLPIKKLTAAERQVKIEKRLCYNCYEAWHKGHKCKGQMALLLLEGVPPFGCDDLTIEEITVEPGELTDYDKTIEAEVGNLYALIEAPNTRCLRLQGTIYGKILKMLIDGGRNHNFIQT